MNQAQKDYLDREIKRSIKWCRRLLAQKSMQLFQMEQHRLGSLWQVRDELRKLEDADLLCDGKWVEEIAQ